MSVHIVSKVWAIPLAPSQKLVLLKLADCADDSGRNAYPSVARMAAECSVSERTVQRTLRDLEESGYVRVEREANDHRPRSYAVNVDRGDKLTGRQMRQTGVTSATDRGDIAVSPDPSVDPSVDPSEVSKPVARAKNAKDDPTAEAFIAEAIAEYGDALGGEAEVRAEIDAAMNHTASTKAIDKRRYVQTWLRRAVAFRRARANSASSPRPQYTQARGRPERVPRTGGFDYGEALRQRMEAGR